MKKQFCNKIVPAVLILTGMLLIGAQFYHSILIS